MKEDANQMMTLDTENGSIQLPIDVEAAAKVADEKRKRNASAALRFRQRQKKRSSKLLNHFRD